MEEFIEENEQDGVEKPNPESELVNLLKEVNSNLIKQGELLQEISYNQENALNGKTSNVREIDSETLRDIKLRIMEKDISFTGGNIPLAKDIYYAQKMGLKLRYIEATLNGGSLAFDGDKYRSSTGDVKFKRISLGLKDMIQGMVRKSNNEDFFWPAVEGFGQVQLTETVKFVHMVRCAKPQRFTFENGIYSASAGNFRFGVTADTKVGSMLLSQKNLFQMTLEGQGIVILELPVHPSELEYYKVEPGRPVRVNGQQVLYRIGNVKRDVRLATTIFGSIASKTGFVEEYTGEGVVVLAPTLNVFEIIEKDLGEDAFKDNANSSTLRNTVQKWLGGKSRNQEDDYDDYE